MNAIQNQVLVDLLRALAMWVASGIEPSETMTTSHDIRSYRV